SPAEPVATAVPIARTDLAPVRAALGDSGRFDGRDQRGVHVLANLRSIPATEWFLVTAMDESEVLDAVAGRTRIVLVIAALSVLLVVSLGGYEYRRRLTVMLREMYAAEHKEREGQAVFRTTLYSIGDAVITTDADRRVTALNRVAEDLTGWSDDEARSRPLAEVYRIVDEATRTPPQTDGDGGTLDGRASITIDQALLLRRSGGARPIASSSAPIVDALGTVHGTVLVFRDQTAQRKQEASLLQAEKMASMGRMAGGIAHDFNNVLSVISGAVSLARQKPRGAEIGDELAAVDSAAARAAELTRQLLAFARQQPRAPGRFAPGERVDALRDMLRRLAGNRVTLSVDAADGAGVLVEMDPTQFDQVLLNLVVNARDAMPDGGSLRIASDTTRLAEAHETSQGALPPGRYARIVVEDTGAGMSRETQQNMFEPFYTTKGDRGTGLGLATVSAIVRDARGAVVVTSEPGRGTRFEVLLPAAG
ncbi:MAG: ATP-binding protein, partial [Gemmatimonadales bacterium]